MKALCWLLIVWSAVFGSIAFINIVRTSSALVAALNITYVIWYAYLFLDGWKAVRSGRGDA